MKNNPSLTPFNTLYDTVQRTCKRSPLRVLLALIVLQLPVIGYCDSGNGWFRNLFEAKGKNMKELTLAREVIIKDESGFLPEPHVISRASDGGFIIAGSLGKAWAIKTDATGRLLWRVLRDKPLTDGGHTAEFTGAVSMPDSSTYLCGNTSLPSGDYTPSLLTHLNAAGRLIDEQLFLPQARTERGLSYFDDCIQWGDNLLIIGHIFQFNNKGFGKNSEHYYWMLMLDSAGKIKWEKQLPTKFDVIDEASILMTSDSSLVFAGRRVGQTELFRINMTGELIAKKTMDGYFAFVEPAVPDGILRLYGYNPTEELFYLITLNEQLNETQRVKGSQELDFGGRFAYRMPDQSLVLFGGEHQENSKSAVAHVDAKLQSAQKIELLRDTQFFDNGAIYAVSPTGKTGEFITVRKLMKHTPIKELLNSDGRNGANIALDFIQVKNK